MERLTIPDTKHRWDCLSLGEVMLRLDPGEGRIHTASPPASSADCLPPKPIEWAVRCGVAHGALAMTTPGDTSMATLAEVERVIKGGSARIAR